MSAFEMLGDPSAAACEGDACALPLPAAAGESAADEPTPDEPAPVRAAAAPAASAASR